MRVALVKTLVELATTDPRIMLLTGDLGYTVLEPFAEKFPERFLNVGVAEQNMVGIATGLAEAGYIPFLYSIVTFASLRPYEFIRNGPILHHLPVRIAGIGGGFEYGHAGPTHHGLEDVGVMRVQPGITLVAPADHQQARTAIQSTWDMSGPVYYRLGKDDRTTIPELEGRFDLGRVQTLSEGDDIVMVAMGPLVTEVLAAAKALEQQGIGCTVVVVACLNPAPVADLVKILSRFRIALTVEAHYIVGGVGSLVSEVVAESGINCRVVRCGVRTSPDGVGGSQRYLQGIHGLSQEALVQTAMQALEKVVS